VFGKILNLLVMNKMTRIPSLCIKLTSLRIRYINSTKHRFKTRERIVFFYEFQQLIIIITVEQWTVLFIVNIVVNRSKTGQARRKQFKQMLHGSVLAA
jgi:hypothetical protein